MQRPRFMSTSSLTSKTATRSAWAGMREVRWTKIAAIVAMFTVLSAALIAVFSIGENAGRAVPRALVRGR